MRVGADWLRTAIEPNPRHRTSLRFSFVQVERSNAGSTQANRGRFTVEIRHAAPSPAGHLATGAKPEVSARKRCTRGFSQPEDYQLLDRPKNGKLMRPLEG